MNVMMAEMFMKAEHRVVIKTKQNERYQSGTDYPSVNHFRLFWRIARI